MYCSMEEAYPENINKPIDRTNARYNRFYRDKYLVQCPDPDKVQNPFFSAQGELLGTSVSKLRNMEKTGDLDSNLTLGSFKSLNKDDDSLFGAQSNICSYIPDSNKRSNTKRAPKMSHKYCISKFVDGVINSNSKDILSNESSTDNKIYDHIKSCKYCRNQINLKLRANLEKENKKIKPKQVYITTAPIQTQPLQLTQPSANIRELLLIVAVGLLIMCVLDVFFTKPNSTSQ